MGRPAVGRNPDRKLFLRHSRSLLREFRACDRSALLLLSFCRRNVERPPSAGVLRWGMKFPLLGKFNLTLRRNPATLYVQAEVGASPVIRDGVSARGGTLNTTPTRVPPKFHSGRKEFQMTEPHKNTKFAVSIEDRDGKHSIVFYWTFDAAQAIAEAQEDSATAHVFCAVPVPGVEPE